MVTKPLHDLLCNIFSDVMPWCSPNCYFEPPANIQMKYPCLVYSYANDLDTYADNKIYNMWNRYAVTVIDADPDSNLINRIKGLPYTSLNRHYVSDGLHHFVYDLYYNGPRIEQ